MRLSELIGPKILVSVEEFLFTFPVLQKISKRPPILGAMVVEEIAFTMLPIVFPLALIVVAFR